MTQFVTLVVTGLVAGAIYSLIASCLMLSYRTTGIFNLGYGAIAFTAAFMYYLLHVGVGWPIVRDQTARARWFCQPRDAALSTRLTAPLSTLIGGPCLRRMT